MANSKLQIQRFTFSGGNGNFKSRLMLGRWWRQTTYYNRLQSRTEYEL